MLISTLIATVESNQNIIKLKHYMHNELSIYHNKYCKIAFPRIVYILYSFIRPVVGKTTLRQKSLPSH